MAHIFVFGFAFLFVYLLALLFLFFCMYWNLDFVTFLLFLFVAHLLGFLSFAFRLELNFMLAFLDCVVFWLEDWNFVAALLRYLLAYCFWNGMAFLLLYILTFGSWVLCYLWYSFLFTLLFRNLFVNWNIDFYTLLFRYIFAFFLGDLVAYFLVGSFV